MTLKQGEFYFCKYAYNKGLEDAEKIFGNLFHWFEAQNYNPEAEDLSFTFKMLALQNLFADFCHWNGNDRADNLCSISEPCRPGYFCNFYNLKYGFCESCPDTREQCKSNLLPTGYQNCCQECSGVYDGLDGSCTVGGIFEVTNTAIESTVPICTVESTTEMIIFDATASISTTQATTLITSTLETITTEITTIDATESISTIQATSMVAETPENTTSSTISLIEPLTETMSGWCNLNFAYHNKNKEKKINNF